jgi:hypothetical protein
VSHATEGDLHAYLDGALHDLEPERAAALREHLQVCSDCRARLSEEKRWRDGAIDLLGSVAPAAAEPPPFADILAAAELAGPSDAPAGPSAGVSGRVHSGRRPGRRLTELAWAASLLIALGAGWMGRSLMTETGELERLRGLEQNRAAPESVELRQAGEETMARGNRPAEEPGDAGKAELDVRRDQLRTDAVARPGTPPANADAKGQAEAQSGGAAESATESAETTRQAELFDGGAEEDSPAPEEAARQKLAESLPESEAVDADAADMAVDDVSAADAGFARTGLDAEGAVFKANLSWMPVSREDAAHWLSHELLTLVRVTQRLPSGSVLEVVEQAADPGWADAVGGRLRNEQAAPAEPKRQSADSRAQDGAAARTAVIADVREGLYVSLRAPVTPDSLAALASRLRR